MFVFKIMNTKRLKLLSLLFTCDYNVPLRSVCMEDEIKLQSNGIISNYYSYFPLNIYCVIQISYSKTFYNFINCYMFT